MSSETLPDSSSSVFSSTSLPSSSTLTPYPTSESSIFSVPIVTFPSGTLTLIPQPPGGPMSLPPPPPPITVAPSSTVPPPPPPPPPSSTAKPPAVEHPLREAGFMYWHSTGSNGQNAGNEWWMYLYPTDNFSKIKPCTGKTGLFPVVSVQMGDPLPEPIPFPVGPLDLTSYPGSESCTYTGDASGPGILSCPGKGDAACTEDPDTTPVVCDKYQSLYPKVICGLPN